MYATSNIDLSFWQNFHRELKNLYATRIANKDWRNAIEKNIVMLRHQHHCKEEKFFEDMMAPE